MFFFSFSIRFTSLHLLKDWARPALNALFNWIRALSFSMFCLFKPKALSATDLIAKLIWPITWLMRLHLSIRMARSFSNFHRLYIFFFLDIVVSIIWITDPFLRFWAFSYYYLKLSNVRFNTLFIKLLSPFSNRFAFWSYLLLLLYGNDLTFSNASFILPILVLNNLFIILSFTIYF